MYIDKEIFNILQAECSHEGWDGYGATPVNNKAIEAAIAFLSKLPAGLPAADPSVSSDGTIVLEWNTDANHLINVMVDGDGNLSHAYINGEFSGFGESSLEKIVVLIQNIVGSNANN